MRRNATLAAATGRTATSSSRAKGAAPECRLVSPCRGLLDSLPVIYDDAALSDVTFVVGRRRELHCHNNLSTAARNLVAEAINCGSIDNCSVVLVGLNQHFRDR